MTFVSVFLVAAAYPMLLILLALVAQPMRIRMVRGAEDLLAERRITDEQRDIINHMLDSALAFRVGLMLPLAVISVTIDDILGRTRDCSHGWLEKDARFDDLVYRYFVSFSAANPLGVMLAIPLVTINLALAILRGVPLTRSSIEEPILRAAHGADIPVPA